MPTAHSETPITAAVPSDAREPAVREHVNPDGSRSYEVRWRQGGMVRSRRLPDVDRAEQLWRRLRQAGRDPHLRAALSGQTTFEHFFETEWRPWAEDHLQPRNRGDLAGHVRNHVLPRLGEVKLGEIAPSDILHAELDMARCGASDATIAKAVAGMSSVLTLAADLHCIADSPVDEVPRPSGTPRIVRLAGTVRRVGDLT